MSVKEPLRVGVGGPVGSGKTALLDCLCKSMRDKYELAVVTNDIYTHRITSYNVCYTKLLRERDVKESYRKSLTAPAVGAI